jgi:hypothetical protein
MSGWLDLLRKRCGPHVGQNIESVTRASPLVPSLLV